jgi:hypothetical protein
MGAERTRTSRPVSKVENPYRETDVHYLVVEGETMSPDIVEVEKGTPGSYPTLQEAKDVAMESLKRRIEEGMESLGRLRGIGITIPRLM